MEDGGNPLSGDPDAAGESVGQGILKAPFARALAANARGGNAKGLAATTTRSPREIPDLTSAPKKAATDNISRRSRSSIAGRTFIQEILGRYGGDSPTTTLEDEEERERGKIEGNHEKGKAGEKEEGKEDWYARRDRLRELKRREEAMWGSSRVMQSLLAWNSRGDGGGPPVASASTNQRIDASAGDEGGKKEAAARPAIPSFIPLYLSPNGMTGPESSAGGKRPPPWENRDNGSGTRSSSIDLSSGLPRGKAFLQAQAEKETAALHFHFTVASEVEAMREYIRAAILEREELDCE
ncbi:unnamed protein product [Phytomonas sp. Hart1]|nr:unnamed protein product [Phytomonas sp. Hart1]|eukprot:CCW68835.1 unnamed protein product [Phytomonas sp. isolate Hart1]